MSDRQHQYHGRGALRRAEVMAGVSWRNTPETATKLPSSTDGRRKAPDAPAEEYASKARRPRPPPRCWAPTSTLPYKARSCPSTRVIYSWRPDPPGEAHDHPPIGKSIHKDHTNTSLIAEDACFAAPPAIRGLPPSGAWGFLRN